MPGGLLNFGNSKRLRYVKPGHDPRNFNLDPNLVVFDSETIGNLSVLDYGEDVVSYQSNGTPTPAPHVVQVRAWSLDYAPMIIGQIRTMQGTEWAPALAGLAEVAYLASRPTGLFFGSLAAGYGSYSFAVRWTAYRFAI